MEKKIIILSMLLYAAFSFYAKAQPGTLDPTFNPGTGANNYVLTTAIQSDGKIIIGGGFETYNGTAINRIARVNTDGSLDATFNVGTGVNNNVNTIAIQSDGKIIIGGFFATYNGTARNCIARLNTDGSLDATFNAGTGPNYAVQTAAIQNDGKIIIGGNFTSYNGTARNHIARINSDGSLDATFNPGTGTNNDVETTAIQSDGKILIGGHFATYNGTVINRIARINPDGSLDATFNVGTGANDVVYTTTIQSDGKIIIGGEFYTYNGTARNRIARLNTDGSLDFSFNVGTGANNYVWTTTIQSDGKIIIGGDFAIYNGTAINRIARINTDGSIDATFNPGTGANSFVFTTAIQSDGKIIIGGDYTDYNGINRNKVARIFACSALPAQPGILSGATTPCEGSLQNYSVSNVTGILYLWTFPAGWIQTGGGTTNAIAVTVGTGVGDIIVTPINTCGYGSASALAVAPILLPFQPSTITGNITPYYGTSENYSVTNVAGVTYTWTFPTGWVQTGGGTANAVTVTIGSDSGNVSCAPSNTCGNGTLRTLAVTVIGVGIKEIGSGKDIIISPNPTDRIVSLNFKGYTGEIKLALNNALGELMFSENIVAISDNYCKTINMAKYPNGIYYIQIVNNGKANVKKIVKL